MLHEIGLSLSVVGILNLPFSFFLFPLVSMIIVIKNVVKLLLLSLLFTV